ncbi:patatin-like phospholipase family protein [Candidatus Oscillochloris fontis]|uniref:patatin-like phospholipase family protein n=1 Tax=Candidatus Oscillochloris fontis TaxID=2496868 RepID=UPI00101DBE9F|nr:patatin-like phospholipase family protein [Candidatus Oscillochloris fontis]
MQRSKFALVLAGGGVTGAAYEIGALCAIDQFLEQKTVNEFDSYVGTSAGALVSACLANNISPRTLLSVLDSSTLGIDQLEPHHLFAFNFPSIFTRLQYLPFGMTGMMSQFFTGKGFSLLEMLEHFAPILPSGIYDGRALERYVRAALEMPGRTNHFHELERELAIIATDLDTGDRAIFGHGHLAGIPISEAVSASAAIPFFYRPVRINGHDYIDGGIRGTVSLDVAIEAGAELIVCINPLVPFDNSDHEPGHAINDQGLLQIGHQVFRTFIHAGLHYHIKQIRRRHPKVDIILIEPSRNDRLMFRDSAMNYHSRTEIARHAFETVSTHLQQHFDHYRHLLGTHGIKINDERIRQDLIELEKYGDDVAAVRSIMMGDGALSQTPPDLAHSLAELERVIGRMDEGQS